MQPIREVTDQPFHYKALSYNHADHFYGLQAFKDHSHTTIIAQDRARKYKQQNEEPANERPARRRLLVPRSTTRPA